MAVSENDFYELQGDSYRGSRYGNFVGGGTTPQGNVSSGVTENAANAVGTSADASDAPPTPVAPSQGLTGDGEAIETPRTADLVIGAALPYAGNAIGQAAGSAIGAGASFGEGLSQGVSSLANKVSGGLIGTASTPTNIALGNMGGAAGPATQSAVNAASQASNVGTFGSGANIGAAAGTGIATFATTLLSGGSVGDAAKSGAGAAAGQAIGYAVSGPIGGFIGGFIGGSIFCFAAGTPIKLEDGSVKNVDELELGDVLLVGGMVMACGKSLSEDMYLYKNAKMTGKHAVFHDGVWTRVEDIEEAERIEPTEGEHFVAHPIITQYGVLVTPWFISADTFEVPFLENDDQLMTDEETIDFLNSMTERNAVLSEIAGGLGNA